MTDKENVFVVVDPNDDVHVAFDRAILTAPLRAVPPKISVMVTTDQESVNTGADNNRLYRNARWFDEVVRKPLENCGLEYDIEVSWCHDWQQSVLFSAERSGASEIFVPMHNKPYASRLTFSDSKWELLKRADCPVILVRPTTAQQRKVILAAVNVQATTDRQKELNRKILERGHWVADGYGAELHVVNAYLDSLNYPDRGKLVKETGLPSERIHVIQGYTDNVVSEIANKVKADVVVIGTLGQNGRTKARRGNTAERVISAIDVDAVIINV